MAEGKISGFFKNLGNKINDTTYDMRAESDFGKNHPKYTLYTGSGMMAHTWGFYAEEHLDKGYIVSLGVDDEIKPGHIVAKTVGDNEDPVIRYIAAVEKTTLTFEFEGKSNEKPGMAIAIGAPAEKVEVIKIGDSYYLKK